MRPAFLEPLVELLAGLALMGLGYGLLRLFGVADPFETSGTDAWLLGTGAVTVVAVGFFVSRDLLQRRRR